MIQTIKLRTSILAIFLSVLSIGYTFAQSKVVVVPLGGEEKSAVKGYELVSSSSSINPGSGAVVASPILCPEGKKVLGGGATTGGTQHVLMGSYPFSNSEGWLVRITLNEGATPAAATFSIYAICAEVDEA